MPVEGPVAIVESIAPARSVPRKHVVHIIFAAICAPQSLEEVTSHDAAVAAIGSSAPRSWTTIVMHPPIHRFLERWRPATRSSTWASSG